LTTIGVLTIGVLPGVVLAISLALIHVLQKIYQPKDAILGVIPKMDGYNDIALSPDSKTIPGIIIYRIGGPLLFFNAEFFKSRIHELVDSADIPPRWLVLSMEAVTQLDVTGIQAQIEICHELERKGVQILLARPMQFVINFREHLDTQDQLGKENIFPSVRSAVEYILTQEPLD
jgi:MFS superfamily sulfate permease-like transporter